MPGSVTDRSVRRRKIGWSMTTTDDTRAGTADAEEIPPGVLVLPPSAERGRKETEESLGTPGRPFDRRSPFFIGLSGAFGVAIAYVAARAVIDVSSVLLIMGVALFIAIGLNPIIVALTHRGFSRGAAACTVTLGFLLF